ncbi:MAG: L,D-transpeptidase family protein [Desulfobacca sp.]|uniref:L,D-transpeptidase family protein n=1 Tax=Desulfobacca sp. TaxID=2067990 RepID=UPI00404B048B
MTICMWQYLLCGLIMLGLGFSQEALAADIYQDVYHQQEVYEVKKGDRLPLLAQKRAVRLQFLAKQNNLKNPEAALKPGTILDLSHSFILPAEVSHGLVVNLAELAVYHFHQGTFQHRYPLAAGKRKWETPTGNYKILNKIKNPTWRIPDSIMAEMGYRNADFYFEVPPGPDNPLGAYWMATSAKGVGLHATTAPWSIGRYASHGCLRMFHEHIEELFPQVEVGMPIKIIYKPIKVACTPDNRIFLQVHGDYYQRVPDKVKEVETILRNNQLADLVDWPKVKQVLKERDGIAVDVTKASKPQTVDTFPGNRLYSGEIITKPANPAAAAQPQSNGKRKMQPDS